jgi:hypothetical protein
LHFGPTDHANRASLTRIYSMLSHFVEHWLTSCTSPCEAFSGCTLMNWLDSTQTSVPAPKKKRSLLPLLTVVFVLSYALMTTLIVEQGAAIQSQRDLIKLLMPDSRELWGLKGKAIADQQAAKAKVQAHGQTPATQVAPQTPGSAQAQAPAASQPHAQGHVDKATKPQVQFPPIPASDLDPRRTVRTI